MTIVKGTYAAVWPDQSTHAKLKAYFNKFVPNLVDDFHITTTYSRVILPKLTDKRVNILIRPTTFGYDAFGQNKEYLVLTMKHPTLRALWREGMQMGATWDHRDYIPHISLSTNFDGKLENLPPIPTFNLRFTSYKVEELKE